MEQSLKYEPEDPTKGTLASWGYALEYTVDMKVQVSTNTQKSFATILMLVHLLCFQHCPFAMITTWGTALLIVSFAIRI